MMVSQHKQEVWKQNTKVGTFSKEMSKLESTRGGGCDAAAAMIIMMPGSI